MALMDTVQADIKQAMLARQDGKLTLQTLRMLKSDLLLAVKSKKPNGDASDVSNDLVVDTSIKMIKQRRESITQFKKGGRPDLAEQELKEIDILSRYLPEPLSDEDIQAVLDKAIESVQPSGMKDMGKLMSVITPEVKGRADMGQISKRIKAHLSSLS